VVRELLRLEAQRLGLQAPEGGRVSDEEVLIQQLLEDAIEDRVPTDEDCRRYFEQNPERFRSPTACVCAISCWPRRPTTWLGASPHAPRASGWSG
jgi:hypothetical protein